MLLSLGADGFGLSRRLATEGAGTMFLVATVVGSGIMAEHLTGDVALQLLCNTLPTVAILVVLIRLFAPISGAHFNPAVTLALALTRDVPVRIALAYVAAQVVGGSCGTLLAHLMFDQPLLQVSMHVRTGSGQLLSEAVAAFGLVALVLIAGARREKALPALVGLYIGAAYWFTASTSFANPAVTIARTLTDSFSGIRPVDAPGFIVAQVLGALAAVAACRWLSPGPGRSLQRRQSSLAWSRRTRSL